MVCIIDDREDVWNFAPNLVHVKPYSFFKQTGDINAPPGSKDAVLKKIPEKQSEKIKEEKTSEERSNTPPLPSAEVKNPTKPAEKENEKEDISEDNIKDDLELSDDDMEADEQNDAAQAEAKAKEEEEEKKKSDKEKEKEQEKEKSSGSKCEDDLLDVEDTDDYLLYLEDILKTIHKAYYDLLDQMKDEGEEVPNLKTVIPYVKRKALQGISVVFSGVVPTHVPLRKSRAYLVAKSLGANVTENVIPETKGDVLKTV